MLLNIKNTKTYVISPATGKYKERSEIVLQRLKDAGYTNVQLFISVPAKSGVESLTRTNYAIFEKELNNEEPFIILEDDINFYNNITTIEVPDDYDLLYLGVSKWVYPHDETTLGLPGYHIRTNNRDYMKSVTEEIAKINGTTSTHAILFRNRDFIRQVMGLMDYHEGKSVYHDLIFATNHRYFNVLAIKSPIFYQDAAIGGQQEPTYYRFYEGFYRYITDVEEILAGRKELWE